MLWSWAHVPSNICLLCDITQASRCLVCRLQCHVCYDHALRSVTSRYEQQQRTAEHMHTLKTEPHQLGAAVLVVCPLLLLQTEPDCFLQVLHLQVLFHTLTHHLLNKHQLILAMWLVTWSQSWPLGYVYNRQALKSVSGISRGRNSGRITSVSYWMHMGLTS